MELGEERWGRQAGELGCWWGKAEEGARRGESEAVGVGRGAHRKGEVDGSGGLTRCLCEVKDVGRVLAERMDTLAAGEMRRDEGVVLRAEAAGGC